MTNFNKIELFRDPFFHFCIDDFFPLDFYKRLQSDFPSAVSDLKFLKLQNGAYFLVSSRDDGFVIEVPTSFKILIENVKSDIFLKDLWFYISKAVLSSHPDLFLGESEDFSQTFIRLLKNGHLKFNFSFAEMGPGAFLTPHCDNELKIVSLIFYLPGDDWSSNYSGGTQICQIKKASANIDLRNIYFPFGEAEIIRDFNFKSNRMVGFVKSKNSYHSVLPVQCDNGCNRRAFIVNIERVSSPPLSSWYCVYHTTDRIKEVFKRILRLYK